MTRSSLSLLTAGSSPSLRRAGCMLCALLLASSPVAQAAVTNAGSADAAPSATAGSTRTLDKALNGDLTTGDRNLDLLLDSQRKGGDLLDQAPTAQPMPARPAGGRQRLQPLPAAIPDVQAPRPPDAGQRYEPLLALPERGDLGSAGLPGPKVARDWGGGSGQAAVGSGYSGASIYGDTSDLRSAARPLRNWIHEGVAFVKDHLIAILLAGAAIALLAMGLKAYSRRI